MARNPLADGLFLFQRRFRSCCLAGTRKRPPNLHFSPPDGRNTIRPPGLRSACLPCSTYCSSTPARAKRLAPRPDGPLTHFASPRGEKCRLRPSALSFVGGDHPDRHPPHFAPNDRRSPPRLPRDFYHGLRGLRTCWPRWGKALIRAGKTGGAASTWKPTEPLPGFSQVGTCSRAPSAVAWM